MGGITLDVCRQCRGIWFDNGELRKVTEIYERRGLKGDEVVTEEVRKGMRNQGKGSIKDDAFAALNWFFNSFLGNKLR